MLEILTRITEDNGTLEDLDKQEQISNLIKTASNPVMSSMKHFAVPVFPPVSLARSPNSNSIKTGPQANFLRPVLDGSEKSSPHLRTAYLTGNFSLHFSCIHREASDTARFSL